MKKIYNLIFVLLICLIICFPVLIRAATLENPLGEEDISIVVGNIINKVLGIVGVLAFAMFIYGGILWMTSGGRQEQIKKGRDTLVWAVVGLAFIFFSYTLVHYVLSALLNT